MATGVVKWFNDQKGFGFIGNDAGGPDLFVHYSNIRGEGHRTLAADEAVEFEIEKNAKGQQAINVGPAHY